MKSLKILTVLALAGAIAWAIYDPGFEPMLAVLGALTALVSLFVSDRRKSNKSVQSQTVSGSSTGIQAGGDIHIGSIGKKERD